MFKNGRVFLLGYLGLIANLKIIVHGLQVAEALFGVDFVQTKNVEYDLQDKCRTFLINQTVLLPRLLPIIEGWISTFKLQYLFDNWHGEDWGLRNHDRLTYQKSTCVNFLANRQTVHMLHILKC